MVMTTAVLKHETIRRLNATNSVLAIIASDTKLIRRHGGWYVEWPVGDGKTQCRRWSTMPGSNLPPWSHKWPRGGTCMLALSQLVRWVRGETVLPLSSWRYWCGDRIRLGRDNRLAVVQILANAEWPESVACVLCGRQIYSAGDWYDLGETVGPTCSMSRCDQESEQPRAQRTHLKLINPKGN